ncbi:methylation site containing protein [Shewanella sp. Choline-02u-19]|uniref:GspH/FimT family pseudopilin n=1 Tax=unclassified Shewanella TaxID=196818 RepID=UPI000C32CF82|nr:MULTISPECIES: GspH/FimT family protein [unclassified Shewanella]PKG57174.1 methylation site containing protein [Shewanella sp. GutDb-MelDb]PKH57533.1 methylation site containing protein [Shewanella sp. Bg11-22]PKI28395.1 methylation site containing protein [Shewanella sp. Choline-02u-19]
MVTKIKGFTLVELMVTIAIAAILITIAMPSLTSMYEAMRSDSEVRKLQQTFAFARNQAISYGLDVTVCPLGTDLNTCGTKWIKGITVLYDNAGSNESLKVINEFNSQDTLTFASNSIVFSPDGLASTSGTMTYCPGGATSSNCKSLILAVSGRVNIPD